MDLIGGFGPRDLLEIVILAAIFYRLILLIQGTRAMQMMLGLVTLFILAFISLKLGLHTINWIFSNFLAVMALAMVILFQPELRRALANMGRGTLFQRFYTPSKAQALEEITRTAVSLAGKRIGALITVQRETELANYVEGGTSLDARVSRELLTCVFLPNSPIHDGAAIIKDDRVLVAGAFLPISLDPKLDRELGTRHRAAIGISQETDAVVVVVSEETGVISVASDGELSRNLDATLLRENLRKHLLPPGKE